MLSLKLKDINTLQVESNGNDSKSIRVYMTQGSALSTYFVTLNTDEVEYLTTELGKWLKTNKKTVNRWENRS